MHPVVVGLISSFLFNIGSALPYEPPIHEIFDFVTIAIPDLVAGNQSLPAPADNQTLKVITLGIGVQNYTCDLSNPSAIPVSKGAIATLYDASAVLELSAELFEVLPAIATFFNQTLLEPAVVFPELLPPVGNHFFDSTGAPTFNFNATGLLSAKKVGDIKAPANAVRGQTGSGAVDWLFLEDNGKGISKNGFSSVYRVQTAGGNPPKSCVNQPGTISVPYSAQYWFYVSS